MNLSQPYYIEPRKNNLDLCGEWLLTYTDTEAENLADLDWKIKTQVPNSVYWSLFEAGVSPHPYEKCNSRLYHWVDEKVWYYKKNFYFPEITNDYIIYLCAEGAAYYSRIWVNGHLLGEHEGMFGGPFAQIEEYVNCNGENEIIFEIKACNYGQKDTWNSRNLDKKNTQIVPWNIARDSSTSNGDFIVMGLWKGVRIEVLHKIHMSRPYMVTENIMPDCAKLNLTLEITDGSLKELEVRQDYQSGHYEYTRAYDNGITGIKNDKTINLKIEVIEKYGGNTVCTALHSIELLDYKKSCIDSRYYECQFFSCDLLVENPKLWYPNTLGTPFLYEVKLTLFDENLVYDTLYFDYGIRTVELFQTTGERYRTRWDKFQFVINGKSIFLKGMNWFPIDFLYKIDQKEYEWVLKLAKNAGIQLLRVWNGGGMPETDTFYDICNRLGLIVWQDSFVANMETPNWPQDILQAQVCMNVYRLRNHPSLVIHCGGNEFNPYSFGNAASMFVIERNIRDLDPSRPYKRTTADMGSAHIYRDMEPTWYRHLYKHLPFVGESGIHSFPNLKSLRQLLSAEEIEKPLSNIMDESFKVNNPELLNHFSEYVPERIPRMLSRASQINDIDGISLTELAEATQIASCEFYQIMIEAMRENYPNTAGIMPWVFKRPWTTVGIQLVDGLGEPIAPYYYVKNAYKSILPIVSLSRLAWAPGETLDLNSRVIYDGDEPIDNAVFTLKLFDCQLSVVFSKSKEITLSEYITDVFSEAFEIPTDFENGFFFVSASLKKDDAIIARSVYWPKCLKQLKDEDVFEAYTKSPQSNFFFDKGPYLKKQVEKAMRSELICNIRKVSKSGESVFVELSVENLAQTPAFPVAVTVTNDKTLLYSGDNYFMLDGGEKRVLTMEIRLKSDEITELDLEISAWNADKICLKIQIV